MNKKPKIGIMQGRLSKQYGNQVQCFPMNSWKNEFEIAKKCEIDVIEWIFDINQPNPITSKQGRFKMESLCNENDISINTICADYFMEKKLFSEMEKDIDKNFEILKELILNATELDISCIEIPLVDSSSLKTEENKEELIKNLEKIFPVVEKNNIILGLETDLDPKNFKKLLEKINHPNIMANYDSGNSASLGYNVKEELIILKKWINNIHVKDRKFNGGTVPLGAGDTDFEQFFASLFEIEYTGDLIIQGARYPENELTPEQTCQSYQKFVEEYVNKYYI